jgi:ankyrin repeat protein
MLGLGRKSETRLWEALAEGETAAAEGLIQQEPDLARAVAAKRTCKRCEQIPFGAMPLHVAAAQGQAGLARTLLNAGADIEAATDEDQTPLHCAAEAGQRSMVKLLISKHATINARDANQRTPFHLAAKGGHDAAAIVLLEAGTDPHEPDAEGNTPLHCAVSGGCEQAVASLLRQSVTVDARNRRQRTPLHVVVISEDHSVFSRVDPDRQTQRKQMERIAQSLLEHGADPNAADNTGATALDLFEFLEGDREQDPLVQILQSYGGRWLRYEHRHTKSHASTPAAADTMGGHHHRRQPAEAEYSSESAEATEQRVPAAEAVALGRQPVLIGRNPECDVRYKSRTMSRRHARISYQGGDYVIEDMGSRNGVVINGHKLTGPHTLTPGDMISLGLYEFEFDGHNLIPLTRELSPSELQAEGAR